MTRDVELDTVAAALRSWAGGDERLVEELAWTLVARRNIALRREHPRAYQWARGYLDERKRRARR